MTVDCQDCSTVTSFTFAMANDTTTPLAFRLPCIPSYLKRARLAVSISISQSFRVRNGAGAKTDTGDQFLAGLLKHLRELSVFTNGGYDSYGCGEQMYGTGALSSHPKLYSSSHSYLSSARDLVWSYLKPTTSSEPRTGLSKPYLQLSAIITAGLDGITYKPSLMVKSNPFRRSPPEPPFAELREDLGVKDKLPKVLEGAVEALKGDFGSVQSGVEECFEVYKRLKSDELRKIRERPRTERRRAIIANIWEVRH